ncbi:MAG TPA: transposase [Pyrinomonadaceae bacterium]|nr:transposase [Pyrinomonadaceae bacterium]
MHINFRTYRTIKLTLAQVLHTRANSHAEQHLNTLTLLICGIVGAQHVQFDKLASHAPIRARKNESLITRFRRWVKHTDVTLEALWLPFARSVLAALAKAPLTILLDGTTAGRGCVILMASLVYHSRAIPLLWTVVKGNKGHLPQDVHCALIRRLQELIPSDAKVTLLGDGEFDGTELQTTLRTAKWDYVCRTATNILIFAAERVFTVGDLPLSRGEAVSLADVHMTAKHYGPIGVIGVWESKHAEPLYLITSLSDADEALVRYRLRFRIECLFANHKSRGFRIDKSHLADPERLARLVIATSLAYLWLHTAAVFAHAHGWIERFHRKDRCDLGLFQIGLRTIHYALREGIRVPVSFLLPLDPPTLLPMANRFSVR